MLAVSSGIGTASVIVSGRSLVSRRDSAPPLPSWQPSAIHTFSPAATRFPAGCSTPNPVVSTSLRFLTSMRDSVALPRLRTQR